MVGHAHREGGAMSKGDAIIRITSALLVDLVKSGALKVDGLSNLNSFDIKRMWIEQSAYPSGEIRLHVTGEGLPNNHWPGALIMVAKVNASKAVDDDIHNPKLVAPSGHP